MYAHIAHYYRHLCRKYIILDLEETAFEAHIKALRYKEIMQ